MDKKYEILIEKYRAAEELRQERKHRHDSELTEKFNEKMKELKAAEKVIELEAETKIAWKFRESRKMINAQKKVLETKIQSEMLKLKIRQDILKQQKKILRPKKPNHPKLEPLPYLNKRNQSFVDSDQYSEDDVIEGLILKNSKPLKIGYTLGNTPGPSHKFYVKSTSRHISPEVFRIKF